MSNRYPLPVGAVSVVFGTLPVGFDVPWIITLPEGMIACWLIVRYGGRRVDTDETVR